MLLFWPLVSCLGMSPQQQAIMTAGWTILPWSPKARGNDSFARAGPYTMKEVNRLRRLGHVASPLSASGFTFVKWKDWTRLLPKILPTRLLSGVFHICVCFKCILVFSYPPWLVYIISADWDIKLLWTLRWRDKSQHTGLDGILVGYLGIKIWLIAPLVKFYLWSNTAWERQNSKEDARIGWNVGETCLTALQKEIRHELLVSCSTGSFGCSVT